MSITLKPVMKRALPLAVAAMSLLPLAANTTKNETKVQKPIVPEYLQADKYEKKGDARIKAGLTQEKAYKDEATKAKFDKANLNNDYEISKEEAAIYNWGGKVRGVSYGFIYPNGLVLNGCDAKAVVNRRHPEYVLYPTQEFSSVKYPQQKEWFKKMDKNNDQTLSPTEVLRGRYLIDLEKVGREVNRADHKLREAQHYLDTRSGLEDAKGRAAFMSFWIFAGVVAALGSGAAGNRDEDHMMGCLTMLAGLTAAGIGYGVISKNATNDYEDRWNNKIKVATVEKNAALEKQDKINQDIDFLDAQLSMEYGWDTDVDDNVN